MATSADMARVLPTGEVQYTHISGDGYPSHTGALLVRFYQSEEALDKLFSGDHIEELTPDYNNLIHLDATRDPTWPWDYLSVGYLYQDGAWFYRDWQDDGNVPPLTLLDRAAILRDADSYSGQAGVIHVGGFLDGLNDL